MPQVSKQKSNKLAVKSPTVVQLSVKEAAQDSKEFFAQAIQRIATTMLTSDVTLEKAMVAHDVLSTYEDVTSELNTQAKHWITDFLVTQKKGQFVEGTKGTFEARLGERIQRVEARGVDSHAEDKLTALLHAKALPLTLAMDEVRSYKVNEDKLKLALAEGKLTQAEVDVCLKKVTYAVKRSTKQED